MATHTHFLIYIHRMMYQKFMKGMLSMQVRKFPKVTHLLLIIGKDVTWMRLPFTKCAL